MKGGLHKCEMAERFSDKDIFLLSDKLEKEKDRASYWKEMYEWRSGTYDDLEDRFYEEQHFRIQNLTERDKWKTVAKTAIALLVSVCALFIFYVINCH